MSESVVLASGSASRRVMLAAAGVPHDVMPVGTDEDAIKREGWIGLYRVANVEASDAGVSFDFVERLATF